MSDWTLKDARARNVICRGDAKALCEGEAYFDRAQLLALVDRMLDRITEARAAIITGEAGALDALNAAVRDANGEAALLRELDAGGEGE